MIGRSHRLLGVERLEIDEFMQRYAPVDVRETVEWLTANGYTLALHQGVSTVGAQFVYVGDAEVHITVDRSQWYLDVAPTPGAGAWQYDLLIAAHTDKDYAEFFPETGVGSVGEDQLPKQLPAGVSWRATLPEVLQWIHGPDVRAGVERALHQRFTLMWPRERKR